jgi:hypothetical protein
VCPLSGAIPPFGSARLAVSFCPPKAARARGFQVREPEADEAAFDYVVQVGWRGAGGGWENPLWFKGNARLQQVPGLDARCPLFTCCSPPAQIDVAGPAGTRPLRFPVQGRALLPRLVLEPRVLLFGGVACGDWGDQLVGVTNAGGLSARVAVDKGSPYFQVEPASLALAPGATGSVVVRYRPTALGNHAAAVAFLVLGPPGSGGGGSGGGGPAQEEWGGRAVLAREAVEVAGSCLKVGARSPLPGGTDAMPETFARERCLLGAGRVWGCEWGCDERQAEHRFGRVHPPLPCCVLMPPGASSAARPPRCGRCARRRASCPTATGAPSCGRRRPTPRHWTGSGARTSSASPRRCRCVWGQGTAGARVGGAQQLLRRPSGVLAASRGAFG